MQYSIDIINGTKAIVKYRRYRLLHNKIFIGFTALWFALTLICIVSILELGVHYVLVTIFLCLVSYIVPCWLWSSYVERQNKKIEESIVFPILDEKLNALADKYPSICTVSKRKIINEPVEKSKDEPEDETVIVAYKNGDICEFPLKYKGMEDHDNVMVRELSLNSYVCYDERKIAKAKGWIPSLSLHAKLNLVSALFLAISLAVVLPFFHYVTTAEGSKNFPWLLLKGLVILAISSAISAALSKHQRTKRLSVIFALPLSIVFFLLNMGMPIMAIFVDLLAIIASTALPTMAIMLFLTKVLNFEITNSTMLFVTLVISSFLSVYAPSYIKGVINLVPFVNHTEGSKGKESIADFMKYVYDSNLVNFLTNCIYVVLFGIVCLKKYQGMGPLINTAIDDAIMNAFVVFLALEGVKSSYKKIRLRSGAFLDKLLRIICEGEKINNA